MAHVASLEWLNANLSRAYPFDTSTGGASKALPSQFLVNGCVLYDCAAISDEAVVSRAYISTVSCSDTGVTLSLTCELSTGNKVNFDSLLFISYGADRNSTIKFLAESSGMSLSGSFTVGDATTMKSRPILSELSIAEGLLDPGVVHDISGLYVSAIKVGGTYLSGEVELVAGEGIEFETEQTSSGGKLIISNTRYQLPQENLVIRSDADLLAEALEIYGEPIRSINSSIFPDESGNISIVTPSETSEGTEGTEDIVVGTVGEGTITLMLKKDPCVEDGTIEKLSEQIQSLNERCSILNAAQINLDNAVNGVATQLTRLT